jgi:hypothetical protein
MKSMMWLVSVFAFLVVSASFADAQEIQYLGKLIGREAGLIRMAGQDYEVSVGTVIPGWGTVHQITDRHLILQRVLSEEEKEEIARQGGAIYGILEIHLPHQDLRLVPVPVP